MKCKLHVRKFVFNSILYMKCNIFFCSASVSILKLKTYCVVYGLLNTITTMVQSSNDETKKNRNARSIRFVLFISSLFIC